MNWILLTVGFAFIQGKANAPDIVTAAEYATGLSVTSGVPIQVKGDIGRDFVYVERHGAPLETTLTCLANALNATLFSEGVGWRIERTQQDFAKLRGVRAKAREEWIRIEIRKDAALRSQWLSRGDAIETLEQRILSQAASLKSYSSGASTRVDDSPIELLPAHELLEGLCQKIGLTQLAEIPSGQVRVYEDEPIADADPLPDHADLMEQYRASVDREALNKLPSSLAREMGANGGILNMPEDWRYEPGALRKLRLNVRSSENMILVSLDGYAGSGNRILQTAMAVLPKGELRLSKMIVKDRQDSLGGEERLVPLSTEAAAALRFAQGGVWANLPAYFAHPDAHEPLDIRVKDVMAALAADHPNRCFAAHVDDLLHTRVGEAIVAGKVRMSVFTEVVDEYDPYVTVETPQWVAWRPLDPENTESTRADRKVLANFVTQAFLEKSFGLRELGKTHHDASPSTAAFARSWPPRVATALGMEPVHGAGLSDDTLRLIGAIQDLDWARLLEGNTLTASEMGVEPELKRMLMSASGAPISGPKPVADLFLQHPIELFPSGNVGDVKVKCAEEIARVTRVWNRRDREPEYWSNQDLTMFGLEIPALEVSWKDNVPTVLMPRTTWEKRLDDTLIRRGVRQDFVLRILLPQNLTWKVSVPGQITQEDPVAGADLSQDERDNMWAAVCDEAIRESRRRLLGQSPTFPLGSGGVFLPMPGG